VEHLTVEIQYWNGAAWVPLVWMRDVVDPGVTEELVALARTGNKGDFFFLSGSSGVALDRREELWIWTRKRLGMEA
jgi:hypothetical protein